MKRLIKITLILLGSLQLAVAQTENGAIDKADSLYRLKKYADAGFEYSKLIHQLGKLKDNDAGHLFWYRGRSYSKQGKIDSAIMDYDKAILNYSSNSVELPVLLTEKGRMLYQLKRYSLAINSFDKVIALGTNNDSVYFHRGIALYFNRQDQLAIDDLSKALSKINLGDNLASVLNAFIGNSKVRLRQYEEALEYFNKALLLNPNNKTAYMTRAMTLSQVGNYKSAIEDFTKALDLYKDDTNTLSRIYDNRAFCYRRIYNFDEALKDVEKGLPIAKNPAILHWNRASTYSQMGRSDLAIKDYKTALALYRSQADINNTHIIADMYSFIADEYYTLKDYNKAIEESHLSIDTDSTNSSPYFLLGKIYLKHLKNKDLAVKNFSKVIALDTTRNSTGYIFSTFYLGKTGEAVELAKKQLQNEKDQSNINIDIYNLACLSSLMRDYKQANEYLKKIVDVGYPKQIIENDEDFDNIRSSSEYIAIMKSNK